MTKLLCMTAMPKAKTETTVSIKQVTLGKLSFISVDASQVEQPIAMKTITPPSSSAWRGGFNRNPNDLENKMIKLLQKDLNYAEFNLT